MAERTHLSIGEVLSLLREEFPDVTISKIRFLESQGLVDPERTPSGYRKFYDHDVERLRWILRQQRENFLPLKIIRGRLTEHGDELEEIEEVDGGPASERAEAGAEPAGRPRAPDAASPSPASAPSEPPVPSAPGARGRQATIETSAAAHPAAATRPRQTATSSATTTPIGEPARGPAGATQPVSRRQDGEPRSASASTPGPAERPGPSRTSGLPLPSRGGGEPDGPRTGGTARATLGEEVETFSAEELAAACDGTVAMVVDLQQYGLITVHSVVGGVSYYDASALKVAKAAAGFARHGVEARHLRAWRNAADREAGIFEQVIVPLLRQRNPEARRQAVATLAELASLGGDLRQALVDQALRQIR
jgi:DNA-binding transcriptional MerR regulator